MDAIWNANPTLTRLYCFDDGNCFAKLSDAMAHKKTTQTEFKMVEKNPKTTEEQTTETKKKK